MTQSGHLGALCRERTRAIQPLTGLPLPPRGIRIRLGRHAKHIDSVLEWRFSAWPSLLALRHRLWHHRQYFGDGGRHRCGPRWPARRVAIGLHFLPLPYVVMAVVCVWRSADKYREDSTWAGIAKAAVIVWGALMVFV
jgi:hypothetical protein